jgi:hypothetical protein
LSGRGIPAGGIARLRNFTMTFSHVSAEFETCSASVASKARFAVLSVWLWQEMQYFSVSCRAGVAEGAAAF